MLAGAAAHASLGSEAEGPTLSPVDERSSLDKDPSATPPPRNTWAMSEDVAAPGMEWVEVRNTAQDPAVAGQPHPRE